MTDLVTGACRALAHPTRRALLEAMISNECDVGGLGNVCGLDQPAVSKQLAALRRAGLVRLRVDGRRHCYSLVDPDGIRALLDLLDQLGSRIAEDRG